VLLIAKTGEMDFELLIIKIKKRLAIWDPRKPEHLKGDLLNDYCLKSQRY